MLINSATMKLDALDSMTCLLISGVIIGSHSSSFFKNVNLDIDLLSQCFSKCGPRTPRVILSGTTWIHYRNEPHPKKKKALNLCLLSRAWITLTKSYEPDPSHYLYIFFKQSYNINNASSFIYMYFTFVTYVGLMCIYVTLSFRGPRARFDYVKGSPVLKKV